MEKYDNKGDFPAKDSRCPQCREKIAPADVEMFPACPYCGKQFNNIQQIEDYAISGKIREWTVGNCARFIRGRK